MVLYDIIKHMVLYVCVRNIAQGVYFTPTQYIMFCVREWRGAIGWCECVGGYDMYIMNAYD